MAHTWDMSFLVDQASQIQEARGNLGRHFGVLQQVLVGKHLINFVSSGDRLAFLRMMERLSQRALTETISVQFKTPMSGERKLALQARPGPRPTTWWLLLSDTDIDAVPAIGAIDEPATESEFGTLIAAVAGDQPNSLDLSVFRAALLADNQPSPDLSDAKSLELDHRIGQTLRENATGGIVTQPSRGEYALVHDREIPAEHIAERIAVAADALGVSARTLGLSHDTEPVPEDAAATEVRDLIHAMRQDLKIREKSGAGGRKPSSSPVANGGEAAAGKTSLLSTLMGLISREPGRE